MTDALYFALCAVHDHRETPGQRGLLTRNGYGRRRGLYYQWTDAGFQAWKAERDRRLAGRSATVPLDLLYYLAVVVTHAKEHAVRSLLLAADTGHALAPWEADEIRRQAEWYESRRSP